MSDNKENTVSIYNVKTLREALDGLPDDRIIMCQIVGKDGSAWNLWGSFCKLVPNGDIAVLTFEHDRLKTLPKIEIDGE